MASWSITARWVFPVAEPPLPHGVVRIDGAHIEAVLPAGAAQADVDLGNVALLPGFVNAHTHLDLTGLRGRCPPSPDFVGWLRSVVAHRRQRTVEQIADDVRAGVAECLRHGVTLVGDIAGLGLSAPILAAAPLRAVVFYELLGLTPTRADQAWRGAYDWLQAQRDTLTCRPGLSPHAPYSVHRDLLAQVALEPLPLAHHLAETRAEEQLLTEHAGPFVDFLQELGVWYPAGLVRDWRQLLALVTAYRPASRVAQPFLLVHGNYLPSDALLPPDTTVVYCPRTHAAFGHAPHPWRSWQQRGVPVALGTDSLASNPDLDILAEARFLRQQQPEVPGAVLLRMATLTGAAALGWQTTCGSLTPGKSADLVVLPLPERDTDEPHQLLFDSALPVQATLFRGGWRGGAPPAAHLTPPEA